MRRNTLTNVVELAVKTAHAHRIARQVVAKLAADSVKSIGGVPLPKETGPGAVRSLLSQVANTPSQVASAVSGRAKSMAAAPVTTPLPQLTRPPKVDPPKVTEPEVPIVKSIGGVPLPAETGPGAVRSLLSQVANTPSQVASAVADGAKSIASAPVTTPLPQLTRPPKVDPPKVTEPEVPIVKSIGGVPLPKETGPGAVRSLLSQVANTPESVGRAVADGAKSMAAAPVTTPLPQLTRPPKVDPPKVDPPKVDPPKVPIVKSIGGVPLPKETGPGAVRKMLGQIANTPEEISNAVVDGAKSMAAAPVTTPLPQLTRPPKVDPPKVDPPKVDPPKVPIVKSIGGVPLPKETGPGAVRKMLGQIANTPEEISNAVVSRVMGTAASSPLANATSPAAAPENEFQKLRAIKDNAAYGLAFDTMRKSWQPSDDPLVNIERLGASKDYAKRFPQATVGSEGWLTPEVQESMAKQSLTTPGGITTPELLGDFAPHARFSRAASNATGGDTSAVTEMGAQLKLVGEAAYKKSIGTAQNPTPEQVTAAQSAAAAAQDAVKAWHARNGEAVGWTSSVAARVSSDKGAAAALDKSVIESAKLRVEEMTKNGVSATSAMKNTGIIDWITQNPKSLLVAGGVLAMLFGGKTGLVLGSIAAAFGGADLYQKYQNAQSVAAQNIFALTSDTYAKTLKEDGAPAAANYMANVEAALRKPTGDPARDSANNGALTIFTLNSMHPQFIADRIRQQGIEAISPIVGQGAADAAFTEPAPTVTP